MPAQIGDPGRSGYTPPNRRLTADKHLDLAARCVLASPEEQYHLAAAQAEALHAIAVALTRDPT